MERGTGSALPVNRKLFTTAGVKWGDKYLSYSFIFGKRNK